MTTAFSPVRRLALPALLLLSIASTGSAWAQTAPQTPAPAATAAATELIQALGVEAQFDAIMPMLLGQIKQVIVSSNPSAAKEIDAVMPRLQEKFASRKADVVPLTAQVYARRLSVEDMKAMTTFFRSDAGKRFIATQPQIMQESMAIGQEWGRRLGQEVDKEMRDELQKRGVKL